MPPVPSTLSCSSMAKKRDTRTALEKWDQGISEARFRGYWHILQHPIPIGLFGGWDHTKTTSRNYARYDMEPVQLRSRGTIEPNCRDDTAPEVFVTVTTLAPVTRDGGGAVDQTTTRRHNCLPCLPARKQSPQEAEMAIESFREKMKLKLEEPKEKQIDTEGGPRWIEWCAWDEQYLWDRYRELGRDYRQPRQPFSDYSLTDGGYRQVKIEMERLAVSQGIMSWNQLFRKLSHLEKWNLAIRFENYLKFSKHMNAGKSRPLPQSWSGRGFHHLNYVLESSAFKSELRAWTDILYSLLNPGKEEQEEAELKRDGRVRAAASSHQQGSSYNLPPFRHNDTSIHQQEMAGSQLVGRPWVQQYNHGNVEDHNPQLTHGRVSRSQGQSQTDHLLPAGLLGDDDAIQEERYLAAQHSTVQPVGRNPRAVPAMRDNYRLF